MGIAVCLPEKPSRKTVVMVLREKLEIEVQTEHLIDWIQDMWNTIDILAEHFGEEEAHKIIHAHFRTLEEEHNDKQAQS